MPLVVRWPGRFEGGRRVPHSVHLVDLAPTIARAAGARVPSEWVGAPLGLEPPDTDRPLFAPYVEPPYDLLSRYGPLGEARAAGVDAAHAAGIENLGYTGER